MSNVSGEQYISGNNDFVESQVQISLMGESWLENLKFEMLELEALSKKIYMSVLKFFKSLTLDSEAQAKLASHLFWQLCERKFQALINACDAENSLEKIKSLRNSFVGYAYQVYEQFCPKETARQLEAWAKNRPNFSKYINS